jgi:hypothetical protein
LDSVSVHAHIQQSITQPSLLRAAGAGVPAAGHVAGPGGGHHGRGLDALRLDAGTGRAARRPGGVRAARVHGHILRGRLTGRARRAPPRLRRRLSVARGHRRVHGRVRPRRVRAAAQGVPRQSAHALGLPSIVRALLSQSHQVDQHPFPCRSVALSPLLCTCLTVCGFLLLSTVAMGTRCSWMLPPLRPADHSLLRNYYYYYNVLHFFRDFKITNRSFF